MTVLQHLKFILQHQYKNNKRILETAEELLTSVHLENDMNRLPHQLSGGEQQRLAIIRALAQDPSYLLMDEPFSNLDPFLKEEQADLLLDLKNKKNIGIVCVTHSLVELKLLIDKIAILRNGGLIQVGSTKEVFENPSNQFVKKMMRL